MSITNLWNEVNVMNKIGIQLYSVRDHLTTKESAREIFKKLRELGYTEAQTAGCYDLDYGVFGKLAQALRILNRRT